VAQNSKESNNNLLASNASPLTGFYFILCILYMFDFCDYSSTGKVFCEQRGLTYGLKYWLIWS